MFPNGTFVRDANTAAIYLVQQFGGPSSVPATCIINFLMRGNF